MIEQKENTTSSPLLSVIVPVYNVQEYLERCIRSILEQTYRNLELILVDDGSKDTSFRICNEYKEKDTRVVVVKQANAGSSVARNTGLKLAKGNFIGFVDSDDWLHPRMFQDMISFAISKNLPVVECSNTNSKDVHLNANLDNSFKIESQEEAMYRIIEADGFAVWRRIYHKDIVTGMTFIPGKIHQDVFYTLDVVDKINKMGYLHGKYYIYNIANESIIRSAYNLKKLDAKDAVYYVRDIAGKYKPDLRDLGTVYLMKGLINHYIPLFSHEHLDPVFEHRKQLKAEIKQHYKAMPAQWNIEKTRGLIVIYTPFWAYKTLLLLNRFRIELKLKVIKHFNV